MYGNHIDAVFSFHYAMELFSAFDFSQAFE